MSDSARSSALRARFTFKLVRYGCFGGTFGTIWLIPTAFKALHVYNAIKLNDEDALQMHLPPLVLLFLLGVVGLVAWHLFVQRDVRDIDALIKKGQYSLVVEKYGMKHDDLQDNPPPPQ